MFLTQDMHASMTDDYGIPVWGSYLIFAIVTIVLGLLLGLVSKKNHLLIYDIRLMMTEVFGYGYSKV